MLPECLTSDSQRKSSIDDFKWESAPKVARRNTSNGKVLPRWPEETLQMGKCSQGGQKKHFKWESAPKVARWNTSNGKVLPRGPEETLQMGKCSQGGQKKHFKWESAPKVARWNTSNGKVLPRWTEETLAVRILKSINDFNTATRVLGTDCTRSYKVAQTLIRKGAGDYVKYFEMLQDICQTRLKFSVGQNENLQDTKKV